MTGVGVGLVTMGALATVNRIAPPERRGEILSTLFVAAYAGLAIPAICVGIASEHWGFFPATLTCAIAIAILLAVSAAKLIICAGPRIFALECCPACRGRARAEPALAEESRRSRRSRLG